MIKKFLILIIFISPILVLAAFASNSNLSKDLVSKLNQSNPSALYLPNDSIDLPPNLESRVQYKILFAGDTMLARSIGDNIVNNQIDPFEFVKDKFLQEDFVILNLETNLGNSNTGNPRAKPYTFKSPIGAITFMKNAGVDAVSLANNHTMDFGPVALLEQIELIEDGGILTFGAGENKNDAFEPIYLEAKYLTIGLIGVNDIENWSQDVTDTSAGSANFNKDLIKEAIEEANEKADLVIVVPHWGIEYDFLHSARQEEFAHLFIDSGADAVIGAHPHVIQDIEKYEGKMIYYSMGNFVFDGMGGMNGATDGIMVELIVQNKEIIDTNVISIAINNSGLPEILTIND